MSYRNSIRSGRHFLEKLTGFEERLESAVSVFTSVKGAQSSNKLSVFRNPISYRKTLATFFIDQHLSALSRSICFQFYFRCDGLSVRNGPF